MWYFFSKHLRDKEETTFDVVAGTCLFPTEDAGLFLTSSSEAQGVWGLGNLEGGGWGEGWVRGGQFTSNLGLRWTDPVTARRVPSK